MDGLSRWAWLLRLSRKLVRRQPRGVFVWFRSQPVKQEVQLQTTTAPAGDDHAKAALPLLTITNTLVGAALGYTRRYRRLFFLQQCLFKHLRRYLIVLEPERVELRTEGIAPRFRACWRVLNAPTGEVFLHPETTLPV